MTAVDTNVAVRFLVDDEPRQSAAAKAVFQSSLVWIGKTVLLETAWVLRSTYRLKDVDIRDAFTRLLGLDTVHVEDRASIASALDLMTHGVQFADAIQLSGRPKGSRFVTFDQSFVRCAHRAGVTGISELRPRR